MAALNVGVAVIAQVVFGRAAYQAPILDVISPLSVMAIPLSIGVAILRHRLYDIDVVINRTAVIAVLTLFITVTYVAPGAGRSARLRPPGGAV